MASQNNRIFEWNFFANFFKISFENIFKFFLSKSFWKIFIHWKTRLWVVHSRSLSIRGTSIVHHFSTTKPIRQFYRFYINLKIRVTIFCLNVNKLCSTFLCIRNIKNVFSSYRPANTSADGPSENVSKTGRVIWTLGRVAIILGRVTFIILSIRMTQAK